jgi:glycosyltransferase involved in cell wall biosynthesis
LPTLWIDVEDLFDHAAGHARPSGIQRLSHEVGRALRQRHDAVRFLRHDPPRGTFRVVPWSAVADVFARMAAAAAPRGRAAPATGGIAAESGARWRLRRLVYRLPPDFRRRLLTAARQQALAWAAWADLLRVRAGVASRADMPEPADPAADFASLVRPGDVLAAFGAPWRYPDYAGLIAATQRRFGVRFALLVCDIIPIRRPEWFDPGLVRVFSAWFAATLPLADTVFAISRATAADVARFAADAGIPLAGPVQTIPIGSGFGATPAAAPLAATGAAPPGPYVLCVSTIEARKNHLLLFRVWRRLLDERPADMVPTLVFAGRVGWLVVDLMRQLENTGYLGGKIRVIEDVSDTDLAGLYRGCLFTLFPSFHEGWGLPVTESLMFGKPCLAARATSLPEAGGTLARYFDPDSATDAHDAIRAVLDDLAGLRAWEAEIARSFAPVPWTATADAILRGLAISP